MRNEPATDYLRGLHSQKNRPVNPLKGEVKALKGLKPSRLFALAARLESCLPKPFPDPTTTGAMSYSSDFGSDRFFGDFVFSSETNSFALGGIATL